MDFRLNHALQSFCVTANSHYHSYWNRNSRSVRSAWTELNKDRNMITKNRSMTTVQRNDRVTFMELNPLILTVVECADQLKAPMNGLTERSFMLAHLGGSLGGK